MRITQTMMTQQFLYNITQDNQRMQQLENDLSTGKTLNRPSNNPLAVSQDMSIRSALNQATGYQASISSGLTWMNNSANTLQNMIGSLEQIQQVVTQGINATNSTPSDRAALADTASQMNQNISLLLDSKQGNRYLFGGTATVGPGVPAPSSYANGPGTPPAGYQSALNLEVASGVSIQINVTAYAIMQQVPSGGTADLQSTLSSTIADLQSGNTNGLQTDLANIEAGITHLTNLGADLGSRIQRAQVLKSQMSQYASTLANQKGVIEDANMAQVITQFNTDQNVYQAALKMGAQVLLPSLVNYLP